MAYSCKTTDPSSWRGRPTEQLMQRGWRYLHRGDVITREPVMIKVTTDWLPIRCGRLEQPGYTDTECAGCALDNNKDANGLTS